MNSAAALSWFARHEIRLAWREWLALMAAGRWRKRSVVMGLIIFAAIMHLPAYAVIGKFANLQLPLASCCAEFWLGHLCDETSL